MDSLGQVVMSPPSEIDADAPAAARAWRSTTLRPPQIFEHLERVEWHTPRFFYGVVVRVGGLGAPGYPALASPGLYEGPGSTVAKVLVGLVSAVVDDVPLMFAVLSMEPSLSRGEWLLVLLTAGVGGSLALVRERRRRRPDGPGAAPAPPCCTCAGTGPLRSAAHLVIYRSLLA